MLQEWAQRRISVFPRFAATERAVAAHGFKITLLLRLGPIFPFVTLNYGLALTSIALGPYALATAVGIVPGTFMFVYIAWVATNAATGENGGSTPAARRALLLKQILLYGVGSLVTLAVVVWISVVARRAITRAVVSEQALLDSEQQKQLEAARINS